jgi:hypothetical protein
MDCAELNGGRPSQVTRLDLADLHRIQGIGLLLASCFGRFIETDDVPTNPCCGAGSSERLSQGFDFDTEPRFIFRSIQDEHQRYVTFVVEVAPNIEKHSQSLFRPI